MSPSRIADFYSGTAPDDRGRYVQDIQQWPDERLESAHDFIQWLFPLDQPSGVNPRAPLVDRGTEEEFASRPELRNALRRSFERMLRFYGFELKPGPIVERSANFQQRARNWLHPGNHNHLRITRILKCLRRLGLEAEARALWRALEGVHADFGDRIAPVTMRFWRAAALD
jgi:hypothetical protein